MKITSEQVKEYLKNHLAGMPIVDIELGELNEECVGGKDVDLYGIKVTLCISFDNFCQWVEARKGTENASD